MLTGEDYVHMYSVLITMIVSSDKELKDIEKLSEKIGGYIAGCVDHSEGVSK